MVQPLETSAKDSYYLLEFRYGPKTDYLYHRITDWTDDVQLFNEPLYSHIDGLDVKPGKLTGDLTPQQCVLELQRGDEGTFFHRLTNGEPHSRVKLTLRQAFVEGSSVDTIYLFKGMLRRTVRNARGKRELVRLEFQDWKAYLEVPLGIPANPRCPWTFGDSNCRYQVQLADGTLSAVDGTTVTITGLPSVPDKHWYRGAVEKEGISLLVREWINGTTFELNRKPPNDWLGTIVTVVEGCDKKIVTCRDEKGNENRFGGIGKGIPSHHPMMENPG